MQWMVLGIVAAMLWLRLIRKRGVHVPTTMYTRVALFTTPLVLVTTTLALWLVLRELVARGF